MKRPLCCETQFCKEHISIFGPITPASKDGQTEILWTVLSYPQAKSFETHPSATSPPRATLMDPLHQGVSMPSNKERADNFVPHILSIHSKTTHNYKKQGCFLGGFWCQNHTWPQPDITWMRLKTSLILLHWK